MPWNLAGHQQITEALARGLREGTLSHAYLLVGPTGVGKRALAIELAAALNCGDADKPCHVCSACRRILAEKHPDVHLVESLRDERGGEERVHREIGIDQIRELQHQAALRPFEGGHSVFIVDGADKLRLEAANCLLKTLEEPPESVVLLLLAAREDLVLPTVTSRCQRIELRPLPVPLISRMLRETMALATGEADLLARVSNGRLNWAMLAARDSSLLARRSERLQQFEHLLASGIPERFSVVASVDRQFSRDRQGALDLLALWMGWWRDLLLTIAECPELITNLDRAGSIRELSDRIDLQEARRALRRLELTGTQIEQNVNLRLAFEALVLDMPSMEPGLRPRVVMKGDS